MKFLPVLIATLVASQLALGATSKKIKKVIYDDGSSSTAYVTSSKTSDANRFVRRIIPEVGLVIGDTTMKTDGTRTGLNVGVLTDLLGTGDLVLETGLLYRQLGSSNAGATMAVNYITVPISAKYYLFGQSVNGIYFKGGLTPGINVAASDTDANGNSKNTSSTTNTFDFGFLLAVGGKFNFTPQLGIILEAYYNRGLTNIHNENNPQNPNNIGVPSVNTLAYGLSTGLSIDL